MKRKINVLVPILMFVASTGLMARELRTPWSLERGYMHAPIPRPTDCDTRWNYDTWAGALHKESNKAFKDKQTFGTDDSLAGIVFGKNSFIGLDAFAPGTISPANPFLAFAHITPRFDYRENSAYFGFAVERAFGCDRQWRAGFRASIPFRSIKVELDSGPCCDTEESLGDVALKQDERISTAAAPLSPLVQVIQDSFAYRLDFLASLFLTQAGVPPHEPLVKFHNPNNNDITINDIRVSDFTQNPIHVIQRIDGTPPENNFSEYQPVVNALPFVGANGSGPGNNQRARFSQAINYTPLGSNVPAQRQLWIVPTDANDGAGNLEMRADAQSIRSKVEDLLENIQGLSALGFFEDHGVFFNTQHVVGAGDLNTEIYFNREWCNFFFEGSVGVRFPTGVKVKDPGKVLTIFSTGNNRHFETKLGILGTWQPQVWFIARADAFWSHAFAQSERVGAPFKGATVKNIGPTINADISWNYFQGHIDANFFVPCNPRVGFMFGYEWYVKTKDHVSLDQSSATDFLGAVQPLDPTVLEMRTKVISHKVRTEMFHQGDYWELFGGWTHVFAGRNAPKETDWHLGFAAYF